MARGQELLAKIGVSTHSRPKAAGRAEQLFERRLRFQHTAARRRLAKGQVEKANDIVVSTHSRPKAAGEAAYRSRRWRLVSTHSRPKAAGFSAPSSCLAAWFQHTAARRRLGHAANLHAVPVLSFNTQPPEGGWNRSYDRP